MTILLIFLKIVLNRGFQKRCPIWNVTQHGAKKNFFDNRLENKSIKFLKQRDFKKI